jgi:hypothetical protein
MKILNALDLKNGAKADYTRMFSVSQPLQFLPRDEKDEQWAAWNMDWLEWQGLKQIKISARRLLKNYKLAEGIIDKSDYVAESNNDMKDIVAELADDNELEALELKFYPIIPNIVNTLTSEFAKRDKRISFRAVDEYTHNEIIDKKRQDIEHVLVSNAQNRLIQQMIDMGLRMDDPQVKQQLEQQLSPENIKTLPEIQDFYSKSYQTIPEQWASKQHIIDEERFDMDELEEIGFRDKLITDRVFWHFLMFEDDYRVELWNPILTFYHKSPKERYISNSNFVGNVELMTAADVVDNYGWKMTEDQLLNLQQRFLTNSPGYSLGGYQNDGSFYDATRSHAWNTNRPSLEYRQLLSSKELENNVNDIVGWVLSESEDGLFYTTNRNMFRVTTAYWKSQVKIGHLTKIKENGIVETNIVSEQYKITDKPKYNTSLIKNKTNRNLVFGEHIEWVYVNQTWGGIKIGPNAPTMYGTDNALGIKPMYLGINGNCIAPLKFQFKGEVTQYGCKLPVEGRIFSDRNTRSIAMVDALKPFQIGFNIVNNQMADILIDEIGSVVVLDQNTLPRHSMGEDWGKNNLAKAYVAMKDFSMLPLDTSIANTETPMNFQHMQKLDMSQTERLLSRVQLAQFFKQQAYEQVGVSPQRMGQQLGAKTSATEVEQVQVGSYAQTERHFIEYCDHLMPRVHRMRTDLAQWYNVNKPSVRLQLTTSADERVNFEINGTDLLLSDLHVYSSTKANYRKILEQMKSFALNNNTTGASIYDLGKILQTDSIGSLNTILKEAETKMIQERQEKMAHDEKMQEAQNAQATKEKLMSQDHERLLEEAANRKDILVAEIRASGFGATQDLDKNNQSDFIDSLNMIQKSEQYQSTMDLNQQKLQQQQTQHTDKLNLKQQEMDLKRELKDKDLQIAATNRNKYDIPAVKKNTDSKK